MTEKKIYIWDTSIPDTWKKIAGEDYFVHISKSNRAKNTLEFLQETQRYILKIRSAVQESSSLASFNLRKKLKKRSKGKTLKFVETEKETFNKIEPVSSVILPSLSKKGIKQDAKGSDEKVLRKNFSVDTLQNASLYLRSLNQHTDYAKVSHGRQPDFICLPKALKANFNRVLNSIRT